MFVDFQLVSAWLCSLLLRNAALTIGRNQRIPGKNQYVVWRFSDVIKEVNCRGFATYCALLCSTEIRSPYLMLLRVSDEQQSVLCYGLVECLARHASTTVAISTSASAAILGQLTPASRMAVAAWRRNTCLGDRVLTIPRRRRPKRSAKKKSGRAAAFKTFLRRAWHSNGRRRTRAARRGSIPC